MTTENLVRRYLIIGERRFSNYWWATVVLLGAIGFLLTGGLSYLKSIVAMNNPEALPTFLQNADSTSSPIAFFPQGLLMCFYGSLGFLLSLYWWFLIFWNVGAAIYVFHLGKTTNFFLI